MQVEVRDGRGETQAEMGEETQGGAEGETGRGREVNGRKKHKLNEGPPAHQSLASVLSASVSRKGAG